ncbi:uncharacterized protein LOC124642153 [Helicoverpa zea]|uniref:uncharacterized protein LOC124634141 n=1 Tax=Helicoverpa zea TaxID=7113 RepID=UPI001F581E1F|nr:uncharacterized protein LOC124634141 [Helicoverpa zea]XP_047036423.1 uncharacterized protein LOC124642153 [Helicoverpa zea]
MADDTSPTNKHEKAPLRNVSTTRGNKRQALGSPPQETTEKLLSRHDVREIIEEVMETKLSIMLAKFNDTMIALLNSKLQPINEKISAMDDSLKFINSQYEDLLKEHVSSKDTIIELQKENLEMRNNIKTLNMRVDQLEQQTRANNIEIQCLPEKKHENLFNIVSEIAKVSGCVMESRDILHCTRVAKINPNNSRPRSIVVQLASPRIRDQFLASIINFNKNNKDNKLNSMHLGYPGQKSAIFVTEHLSPTYRALHAAARIKAREIGYSFVWIRNGRIFMRKTQESEHILVRNMDTLKKLT